MQVWKLANTLRLQRLCACKPIRPPAPDPSSRAGGALFVSLHAVAVGAREAVAARGPQALDLASGELLCAACGDFVYPSRVEALRRTLVRAVEASSRTPRPPRPPAITSALGRPSLSVKLRKAMRTRSAITSTIAA